MGGGGVEVSRRCTFTSNFMSGNYFRKRGSDRIDQLLGREMDIQTGGGALMDGSRANIDGLPLMSPLSFVQQ